MNPLQMAAQIKHELQRVVWPGAGGAVVFGTRLVHVFAGEPTEENLPVGSPFALVTFDSGTADRDDPGLIAQNFTILVGADVKGDPLGEASISGGATSSILHSANRGVGEIAARVRAAVGDLTGIDGAKILLSSMATGAPTTLGRGRHLTIDEQSFEALCTSDAAYAAPQSLVISGTSATWSGGDFGSAGHCSSRYDFRRYTLGFKTGSAPAATIADLSGITYQGSAASTSGIGIVPGSIYSVFAEYSHRRSSVFDGESAGDEIGVFVAQ